MRTRIVDAIMEVLKENGSLTYKEVYKKLLKKICINLVRVSQRMS